MKRRTLLASLLFTAVAAANALGKETLDTLLPPPSLVRRNADALKIDAVVQLRLEQIYKENEPRYHQYKYKVERLSAELFSTLAAEPISETTVATKMEELLQAENDLKLHQVHVRISILSQLTPAQREAARRFASENPPPSDWRGGIAAKVERVSELGKRVTASGGSIKDAESQMKQVDQKIATGEIDGGLQLLNKVIEDLERSLKK